MNRVVLRAAMTIAAVSIAGACSSGSSAKTVKVELSEYTIKATPAKIAPGQVKFEAKNVGGTEHEMVVIRFDDPSKLPVKPDGSVDEDAVAEASHVGEIEDIAVGSSKSTSFDLTAGKYVIICNVMQDQSGGSPISHYSKGMVTQFTVG
jgi:uncharacterized cupredoxin-like copper-binding protein